MIDGQIEILRDQPLTDSTLYGQLKSCSMIHGFLNPLFSHQFRYGGGKLLDASDQEWGRAMTSISRWRDKRCPRHLDDMEKAFVERDPELHTAIQQHSDLVDDQKQAVIDIERQLSGSIVPDEDTSEASQMVNDMPPEQIRLIEALQAIPTVWTLEGEWRRRNTAVEAIIAYCNYAEGGPLRSRPKRSISRDREGDKQLDSENTTERPSQGSGEPDLMQEKRSSLFVWEKKRQEDRKHIQTSPKPVICFQCGKGYSQHQGFLRHFPPAHLNDRKCNFCDDDMEFLHQMHWQIHAETVHRLHT
ncbi:hypothetical protein Egran_05994 [Elaphomyces granulatus]|uniref:C2H2-type domain-containing protein n=1 Tax=Elaphomyces granulatus TaxID=519963 RepID=A0A232LPY8_9EURO|nr:hypothetical protein Egran_05994 [Elaphomyces granulatus]